MGRTQGGGTCEERRQPLVAVGTAPAEQLDHHTTERPQAAMPAQQPGKAAEAGIAAEQLITAQAAQHDLEPLLARKSRHAVAVEAIH